MTLIAGLYVVSTPIGNLLDITFRAIETLKNSELIFCEDTRISLKLLAKYNINVPLFVYNDKSDEETRKHITKSIKMGKVVSLISSAGTPLIADPGYKLVKHLKNNGYFVNVIPGVSAPVTALTLSGLPSDRFLFAGFLPRTDKGREKIFTEFSNVKATLIFFERATRIIPSLEAALKCLGNRKANISRELTKLFQESKLDTLQNLIIYYKSCPPKGELTLLIYNKELSIPSKEKIFLEIKKLFVLGMSAKDISHKLSQKYHNFYKKTQIYRICNSLKDND